MTALRLQRPTSATSAREGVARLAARDRPTSAKDPMSRVKSKKVATSSFFMEGKGQTGDGTGTH